MPPILPNLERLSNIMQIQPSTKNLAQIIDVSIDHIDVKGQYIQLAAPIRLYGQLNTFKLFAQYERDEAQRLEQ